MAGRNDASLCQFADAAEALGRAVNLLQRVEPFASYHFGRFASVLQGQVRRRHYVFAVAERNPVGYAGWALCDEDVARAWLEWQRVPRMDECVDGACLLGLTFYAIDQRTCLLLSRYCRAQYPGKSVFGIRDTGDRERPAILNVNPGRPLTKRAAGSPISAT